MKGTASVNPVFEPLFIMNPHIYNINPLILTDLHRLYFKTNTNSSRWDHKSIINCTFSQKYGALLILSQQGRLHVFTQNLNQIARIPWQSKYSVGLQFIDQKNMFLMIGATQVQLQYVKVYSNIKSTKFVSSMNFGIQKKEKYIADSQTKLQWNKGYNYNLKENMLYLWSSKDINFYALDNLELKSRIVSLTRKDMSITYVLFNFQYKYTITGLINGHIKVWRLPQSLISSKDYILIHKYIRHTKPIDKIVEGTDDRIIISCSQELLICLWSLETFELLREYDFMGQYTSIHLYNGIYSLAIKQNELGKLKFGKTLQFITDITSEVIYIDKYRKQPKLDRNSPIENFQITLGSNLGFQIRNDQLDAKDLNKIEVQYIYPPLKAKGITQIISNPFTANQYYLLVQNGQVFRLRIQNGSGKIEQSYSIQRTKDVQFHQLNQTPTIIKFLNIVPPQFDSEINENTLEKRQKKQVDEHKAYIELKLIAVGCNKGTIVFLKTTNIQQIYTRVTFHRQAIIGMESFRANGYSYLISYCMEQYLKIIRFDSQKTSCLYSLHTGDSITVIKGLEDRFALVLKKGFFEVFQLDEQQKDFCIRNSKSSDHQQEILAIDSDPQRKILLTAAADNIIKIWTYYKILLYEIILDDGLKNAAWFRPFQMIVSHNLKILYFKNIGFKITEKQIEMRNQEFLVEKDQQKFTIQEIIKRIKSLKQDPKFQLEDSYRLLEKLPQVRANDFKIDSKQVIQRSYNLRSSSFTEKTPKKRQYKQHSQQKKKRNSHNPYTSHNITLQQPISKPSIVNDTDLEAVRKHIDDIRELRKQTNQSLLPKIKPKSEDAFDNFMKSKLINKKVLTRRDITLNRIIMKNIIKQHFGQDNELVTNLKLDF